MKRVREKCNWIGVLSYCMLFYLLVNFILYMFVKEINPWTALAVIAINYPIMVLVIATILRMHGYISERNFIGLVFKGFTVINLLLTHIFKKIRNDSASAKPNPIFRSKKPR